MPVCKADADCPFKWQFCLENVCTDKCATMRCIGGCKEGQCIPRPADPVAVCPSTSAQPKQCTDPRPNEKTCPTKYYLVAPEPRYCGVTAKGERIDFPDECDACKNKNVVQYFSQPCGKAPKICQSKEICAGSACVPKCFKDSECESWQVCDQNKCADRCILIDCKPGYECKKGQCLEIVKPTCPKTPCPFSWQTCFSGKCHDRCIMMKCAGCKYGQCSYDTNFGKKCKADTDCPLNWSCVNGTCVDLCVEKRCALNETCKKGAC